MVRTKPIAPSSKARPATTCAEDHFDGTDCDHQILKSAFEVLCRFVEAERKHPVTDWNRTPELRRQWLEILALWKWWTKVRPARKSPLDDRRIKRPELRFEIVPGSTNSVLVPHSPKDFPAYGRAIQAHRRLERRWLAEDQKNLHRLVEIRPLLWT
jgi:hypothetical protein